MVRSQTDSNKKCVSSVSETFLQFCRNFTIKWLVGDKIKNPWTYYFILINHKLTLNKIITKLWKLLCHGTCYKKKLLKKARNQTYFFKMLLGRHWDHTLPWRCRDQMRKVFPSPNMKKWVLLNALAVYFFFLSILI